MYKFYSIADERAYFIPISKGVKVALFSLYATAKRPFAIDSDRVLDEDLAMVWRLKNSKIAAIETFLSDVDGMNAFFV